MYNKKDTNKVKECNRLGKFGIIAKPFFHREHRTKKRRKGALKDIFKIKKRRIIDEDQIKQMIDYEQ